MTKTRKTLIALFSVLFMISVAVFTLTACGGSKKTLESIAITKKPTQSAYVIGQKFDATGMEVTATYKKGKETLKEVVTGWTYEVEARYLDSEGNFKLGEGVKSAQAKVTVSYTEKDVTVEKDTSVSISKPVKTVTVKTQPEKTSYFAGEVFDVTGLTVDVVYEDDDTENDVVIALNDVTDSDGNVTTAANASVSGLNEDGSIPSGTTAVTLTYGGKDFTVSIELLKGVWIEGETGLFNGEYPNQNSTNDGGQIGMDAALSNAKTNALNMKLAELRAEAALAALTADPTVDVEALRAQPTAIAGLVGVNVGGAPVTALYDAIVDWVADTNNATAINEYLVAQGWMTKTVENEGAENETVTYKDGGEDRTAFLNGTGKYAAASEDELDAYSTMVKQYRANGDKYLGGVSQNSTVSFVFGSTGAGVGSVKFRLASAYLLWDNGSWTPRAMGDVKLNVLADVYVNGVKQDVSDDVVLFGGKTADGSSNQALWMNWQEAGFSGVHFVEGRNVIELRIKQHGITSPAQTSYNWSCNVDSMLIQLDGDDDETVLTTYDNSQEIEVTSAITSASVATAEDKVTATVAGTFETEVTGYVADQIKVTIGGVNAFVVVNNADGTFTATADVTNASNFDIEVNDDAKEATITASVSSVTLAKDGDDVVLTVAGSVSSEQWTGTLGALANVTVGNKKMTVVADGANFTATAVVNDSAFGSHALAVNGAAVKGVEVSDTKVTVGLDDYALVKDATSEEIALKVSSEFTVELTKADIYTAAATMKIEKVDDKAIVSIEGDYEATPSEALKTKSDKDDVAKSLVAKAIKNSISNFRLERNPNSSAFTGWDAQAEFTDTETFAVSTIEWTADKISGKFVISIDVTNVKTGDSLMFKHASANNPNSNGDFKPAGTIVENSNKIEIADKGYEILIGEWSLLYIKTSSLDAKSNTTDYSAATLVKEGEGADAKVYVVVTGTSKNYTAADVDELKALVLNKNGAVLVDVEGGEGSPTSGKTDLKEKMTFNFDAATGNYTVKIDVTDIPVGWYWVHCGSSDVTNPNENPTATLGSKTYHFEGHQYGWGTGNNLVITDSNAPVNLAKVNNDAGAFGQLGKWTYYIQGAAATAGCSSDVHNISADGKTVTVTFKNLSNNAAGDNTSRIYYMAEEAADAQLKLTCKVTMSVAGSLEAGNAGTGKVELAANVATDFEIVFNAKEKALRLCPIVAAADKAEVTITLSDIVIAPVAAEATPAE